MNKRLISGIVAGVASIAMITAAAPVAPSAFADDADSDSGKVTCPDNTLRAKDKVNSYAECNLPAEEEGKGLMPTIQTIVNVIITIIGIVAVLVMILGGFQYMTSSGDSTKVKKGKDTILYGVIGLVIALLAYAIVNFVMSSL